MKKVHTDIEIQDIGDNVCCDVCNESFPEGDQRCGGFLFGSYAYCPECATEAFVRIVAYGEQDKIKAFCPDGMTFHDWVMKLRGGDNTIKIITKELR